MDSDLFLPDDYVAPPVAPSVAVPQSTPSVAEPLSLEPLLAITTPTSVAPTETEALQTSDALTEFAQEPPLTAIDWDATSQDFDVATRTVAKLAGQRDALAERETRRTKEVAEAKGRGEYRSEVEEILEVLQRQAHTRSVGAFEEMLTAIARDVQPSSPLEVKLELGTERNMPALDIVARSNGEIEDITSGALSNVTSTGLRFITLARSGRRPFLLLDEADCWIENNDVENFFEVVHQLSRDAGIQAFIITHHDLTRFEDRFRIYRIQDVTSQDKWPRMQPDLVSSGSMDLSDLQQDSISFLKVRNFEAYADAHIELSPGVTAITGRNRACKSGWARAMRAAFQAEASDRNIRHGQSEYQVAAGFSSGMVLEHTRRRKGTSKGDYVWHTAESFAFADANPTTWRKDPTAPKPTHQSPGVKLPEWVPTETGISSVDGINVQLWGQFTPVFMLDQPPSKRASLLSIGRESGHLMAMNETFKEDVTADNKTIRDGEKEIFLVRGQLEAYVEIDDLKKTFDRLAAELQSIQSNNRWLAEANAIADALERNAGDQLALNRWRDLNSLIPGEPEILRTDGLTQWLERSAQAETMIALRSDIQVPNAPEIQVTRELEQTVQAIAVSAAATTLRDALPAVPTSPEILETSFLSQITTDLDQAVFDSNRPIIAIPTPPTIVHTHRLAEWVRDVDQANADMQRPLLALPTTPVLLQTAQLDQWLEEMQRNTRLTTGLKGNAAILTQQFEELRSVLDCATEALGYQAFELPAKMADELARDAVIAFESGSTERVVAHFEQIKEKIQQGARRGFLAGTEKSLDLPSDYLHADAEGTRANVADRQPSIRP